jgi:hypothetical protein
MALQTEIFSRVCGVIVALLAAVEFHMREVNAAAMDELARIEEVGACPNEAALNQMEAAMGAHARRAAALFDIAKTWAMSPDDSAVISAFHASILDSVQWAARGIRAARRGLNSLG